MSIFADIRLSDLFDIAIVAALLWLALAWFRTARARMALLGLAALAGLFLVARGFDLQLTTWLLQGFFAVATLVLVVVFQDDLRRLFEGIAVWGLRRGAPRPPPDVERILVEICFHLAKAKIGALIVLPGREPLERHLEGGVHLAGRLSEQLLLSIFDTGSPGHDGAVVVGGKNVVRFGVHLPLSTDWDAIGQGGTRHAAAVGLAERSDALCIVVSEERGEVSLAQGGNMRTLAGSDEMTTALTTFVARFAKSRTTQRPIHFFSKLRSSWREGVVAAGLATGLWYIAIPGAAIETAERSVAVVVENLPEGYQLVSVDPPAVSVRFQGRNRDLYLVAASDLSLHIDALLVQLGRRTFTLSLEQVHSPDRLQAISLDPPKVKLTIKKN